MSQFRIKFKKLIFTAALLATTQAFSMSMTDINSYISDSAITTNIRSRIVMNQSLSNFKMEISTVDGVVSFNGTVESDAEAAAFVQVAQSSPGVKGIVVSKLIIKQSKVAMTDTMITAKVRGLFIREKLFGEATIPVMTINVETKNGFVFLTGKAISKEQIEKAANLAYTVDGVKQVESDVAVGTA
jgi:hyperosmotically inducible protein